VVTAVTAALLLAAVAGFNAVIDPYGMYRLIEIKKINSHKPAIYNRVRLFKAYDIRRIKPGAVVLGTSRSHVAMRMSHDGWDPTATPRYNLAFDGATTKEMYFYLRHAYSIHPLKQVVMGLDTYHPMQAPSSTRPDFDSQLLSENRSLISLLFITLEDLKILTSIDTLLASITTLQSQAGSQVEWFAADGQRLGEVFFRLFEEKFQECPRAYFEEIDKLEVGFKLEGSNPAPQQSMNQHFAVRPQSIDDETSLGYIRRIIEFCRANHIDLRIFITPEHAHQLETSAAVGAWPSVEEAKRNLVSLLSKDAATHSGEPPIPLYDFSGYSSVTTDPLPKLGCRDEMKYYWDSSHFKEIVGDMVLDRLFGISRPERPLPDDFGVLLNADTIESAILRVRADQIRYRRNHPRDISAIRSVVEKAMQKNMSDSIVVAKQP
jgi:hypothetical protein